MSSTASSVIKQPNREVYLKHACLLEELITIGWGLFSHAMPRGLSPHIHRDAYEICYLIQGQATWWVENNTYEVGRGDFYITRPNERHGGVDEIMHPCELYWLQINIPDNGALLPELTALETMTIAHDLEAIDHRSFPGSIKAKSIFNRILNEHRHPSRYARIATRSALHDLLICLLRNYTAYLSGHMNLAISADIQKAIFWIEERLSEPFRVSEVARTINMSESYFYQRFLQEVGFTPVEYYNHRRIQKAQELLCQEDISVTEIAYSLGFSTSQYFATVFKKFVGTTPRQYRKEVLSS